MIRQISAKFERFRLQFSVFTIFLGIWAIFFFFNPAAFSNPYTYHAILSMTPMSVILSMSATLVIVCAEMDLSFPSVMGFSAFVFSNIVLSTGNPAIALLGALFAGAAAGFLNGVLVARVGLPSLITTLGGLFFWKGVNMVLSGGWGRTLGQVKGTFIHSLLVGRIGLIPAQGFWMVIFLIIFWLIMNRHKLGNHVLITGDNVESARMMGINVEWTKIIVFTQMGFFAALAGTMDALEMLNFYPSIGEAFFLTVLAAIFIGGTSPFGGEGTIFGSFVGGLIIGFLGVGILASGLTGFWTQLFFGLIIIVSLVLQVFLRKSTR
jgi:simple sugar transport system permease protein